MRGNWSSERVAETRTHYEAFPFVEGGSERVRHWSNRLRRLMPDDAVRGASLLDVGCGSGEVARGLAERGSRTVCLDLTQAAIRIARQVNPEVPACQASALDLPFADEAFDITMSIGVLHHTPDCRRGLAEMSRVTRRGGRVVILLYSPWTPYQLFYRVAAPLRARVPIEGLARIPKWFWRLMQIIVWLQTHQMLDDAQLMRLLADQLWTPNASFHTARQVREWASELGLRLALRRCLLLHANFFVLVRGD